MRILIDGDACPVKKEIKEISLKYSVDVIYYTSVSRHSFDKIFDNVVYLDNFSQAVDIKIINEIDSDDILVTDDYGLAFVALGKCYCVISSDGKTYTEDNIEILLYQRYLNQNARKNKIKIKNKKKRDDNDNKNFYNSMLKIVSNCVKR